MVMKESLEQPSWITLEKHERLIDMRQQQGWVDLRRGVWIEGEPPKHTFIQWLKSWWISLLIW